MATTSTSPTYQVFAFSDISHCEHHISSCELFLESRTRAPANSLVYVQHANLQGKGGGACTWAHRLASQKTHMA